MTDAAPPRILVVCSHNRTRSVMLTAMLETKLAERLSPGAVIVGSAGFGPVGLPAIPDAVDAMARRGLDVNGHRSRAVTPELLEASDLVLTAERDHVVRIATISPARLRRTMTLPEFLVLSDVPDDHSADFVEWVEGLTVGRTPTEFLRANVGELPDPTGLPAKMFGAAVERFEEHCTAVANRIADHQRG